MCAQLGSGLDTSWPGAIDSYQTYRNGSPEAPDSDTRIDAELVMDILRAIVSLQTGLGARPMGTFGSVEARLNQFMPGGGGSAGVYTFANTTAFTIPGTQHNLGQTALLFQAYDAASPAHAIGIGAYTVDVASATYTVQVSFATPQSGYLALGATAPLYLATFTNATTVNVAGATHGLGTSDILFQVYDNSAPARAMEPGSLTVHPTTHDVVLTFGVPLSGLLMLSAGGPSYATNFASATTVTIPGSTHGLGTKALLFQAYNNATPRAAIGDPSVTVDPTTFDVVLGFGVPVTGRIVLVPATTSSGTDFDIRDAGIPDRTAVRLRSDSGTLHLQAGSGHHVYVNDAIGAHKVTVDTQNGYVGLGTATPAHQLELTANDAAKPVSGLWTVLSDARLKEQVRPFADGLDVLLALQPVLYRYNGQGSIPRSREDHVGLIAQALQTVAPYLVRTYRGRLTPETEEIDLLSLDGGPLIYIVVNALKAVYAQLQRVEQDLEAVLGRVRTLEARLDAPPLAEEVPT